MVYQIRKDLGQEVVSTSLFHIVVNSGTKYSQFDKAEVIKVGNVAPSATDFAATSNQFETNFRKPLPLI